MKEILEAITPITAFFIMMAAIANWRKAALSMKVEELKIAELVKDSANTTTPTTASIDGSSSVRKRRVFWIPAVFCSLFLIFYSYALISFLNSSEPLDRSSILSGAFSVGYWIFFFTGLLFSLSLPLLIEANKVRVRLIVQREILNLITKWAESNTMQNNAQHRKSDRAGGSEVD